MPRLIELREGLRRVRRQEPGRYMANGRLKPCRVCKMVENEGRKLWGYATVETRQKYEWENGVRGRVMEQLPSGEVVVKLFEVVTVSNYHSECEAEQAREARKKRPRTRDRIAALEARIAELEQRPIGKTSGAATVSRSEELRQASQLSPQFTGSGRGGRQRGVIEGFVDLQKQALTQPNNARSRSDPDSAARLGRMLHERRPLNTPADPGYPVDEPLSEEGYNANQQGG